MVGCCVFRPLHPLSSLLCGLSSHCTVASCSTFLVPLVRLVVTLPLQMPLPPICRRLCLSFRHCLSPRHGFPYLLSSWLLHPLYSCRRLQSAGVSASHRAIASRCAMASCTSCPAGCRVASVAHPLGMPLRLVAALPPPLILLACPCLSMRPCLSMHNLHLPPPVCLWLPPPIFRRLRLSSRCHLSLRHGLTYLLSGWLLCCLY
jgi:hypothetical protein